MPKILISHGFGSNHVINQNQSPKLRKALQDAGFELVYVQAPIKLSLEDFPKELPPDHDYNIYVLYTWWDMNGNHSVELAEETIKKYNDDDVVGFIGLSQGGALSGLVCSNYERLIPSLKFGISYSGFYYPSPLLEEDKSVYDSEIELPFLSVIGAKDKVVLPHKTEFFANEQVLKPDIYTHNGAHEFAEDDQSIEFVLDWIRQLDF